MSKIVFTGAQGTGKTTILEKFKEDGYNVITEIVRNLAKRGININKDGDENGQQTIFNEYKRLLTINSNYVSDRCLIDVTAYTIYLSEHGKVGREFTDEMLRQLHQFVTQNPDIIYCYFPIEFDVVADGVRDTDEEFRKEINEIILALLKILKIKFVYVTGDPEERYEVIRAVEELHVALDKLTVKL